MGIPNSYLPVRGYFLFVIKLFVVIFLLGALFTSCTVSKPTYPFKDITRDTVIKGLTDTDVELKIQKNDLLNLSISSLNPAEDLFFNSAKATTTATTEGGVAGGYLVSIEGDIYLHKLGKVNVAGMTRAELKTKLEKDLLPYLKDPIVNVSFANHFVTVMGDVGRSQVLNMPAEKISLIDVIALSGNVTEKGTYKNMLVIRETPGSKEFKHINLEDESIFSSPFYYLQPKDILVINPYVDKLYTEQKNNRNQQLLSNFLSVASILVIILSLFKL
jgi:polysaccharide biosynthesis/export protein